MSSSSKFVIGSDDDPIDEDLDSKQSSTSDSDSNSSASAKESLVRNNKYHLNAESYQTSYQTQHDTDNDTFVYEEEYKAISDAVDTSEYHQFQLILHRIVHPLIWLCDASLIRRRAWIQIPFIEYMIRISSLIIGIAISQLVLITILCIAFLYIYYQYEAHTMNRFCPYHYNYFVQICCGIIGYAILYLLIHIQDEFYSSSVADTLECLAGASMFAISVVGVVVFIKQFVLDMNLYSAIAQDDADEYDSDDEDEMLNEFTSKGVLWFTVSCLTLDVWHVSIGLVVIECVVYVFSGRYTNLLIDWTHDSSTVIHNLWNVIAFGFLLAAVTGIAQIVLQMYCQSPLYEYQTELKQSAMSRYDALPHKEDLLLFALNWLHHITSLWNKILSAAIGWSLLTPNQTDSIIKQFGTAITATLLFLFIAYLASDYKRRIQKDIVSEIRDIRMNDSGDAAMERIVYNKQKLLFYDQLHATYDLAFAVAVSYSWESFIVIVASNIFATQYAFARFVTHLILTLAIASVGAQFGLELVQLKRQRLKEAKVSKNDTTNRTQNDALTSP
eukprot:268017_1